VKYNYEPYWSANFALQGKQPYIIDILKVMDTYKPKTILELGSGKGFTSSEIKNYFPECSLTGIDIIAGNPYLDIYIKADLSEYDTDKKYDCILAQNVLLHIKPKHIKNVLDKIFKWSKNIVVFDYDPKDIIPLADFNFRHVFSMFPHKQRLSDDNSIFYT